MQNEFKYIPYDGKDTNIRGLIKNGNVYSLTRGMSGLLLPDDPNEDLSRAEKDWAYLKEMYPERVRRISAMVEEECKEKVAGMILLFPALCIADDWRVRFKSESEIPKEFEFWGMKLGEEFFKSMRNFKTFDVIGHFERPVLILHGAEDEIVPIGYSVKAVKKYPNARLEEFAHEPHGFSEDGNRRMEAMLLYFVHECMKAGEEWEGRI